MKTDARDEALIVEIADYFDILAGDSEAFAARGIGSKREHATRAKVWREAAADVRSIELLPRADLAPDAAPVRVIWTDAQQAAFARAYDREDAAHRGEPTPWVDGEDTGEWVDERLACVRAGLDVLELVQKLHKSEAPATVEELVEAHRENARVLSHLHNEMQGRVDAAKLTALFECLARSTAVLARVGVPT